MKYQTLKVAFSAFLVAAAFGLAATAPARAESVMKECGDDWKAAKAAGTTNGQTWQEFLKSCRVQKASAPAPRLWLRPRRPLSRFQRLRLRPPRSRRRCRSQRR